MIDAAALGVKRSEVEVADSGEGDGLRAHGARLQGDVEIAVREARRPGYAAGFANGQQLGMGGRIIVPLDPVVGAGDDVAVPDDHRADRDLARRSCELRLFEGRRHMRTGGGDLSVPTHAETVSPGPRHVKPGPDRREIARNSRRA